MIASLHLVLGRLAAVALIVVAATGALLAYDVATGRQPTVAPASVADMVERLARHGTLDRLTLTPAGTLVAQFSAPRRRAAVDPASGALMPLPPPGEVERLATELHRSFGLGSDAGRLLVAAATAAAVALGASGLMLARRRPRRPGGMAASHRWLGLALCLPLALSAATGLTLTAANLFPVAIDGLPPAFVPATGTAPRLPAGAIALLSATPLTELEDLALPRGDDAEDGYRLTTAASFATVDPGTGAVLAASDRPVWHKLTATALRLHAGYGWPWLAATLGLAAAALAWGAVSGLALDARALAARRGRPAAPATGPAMGPADTVVLYGTALGTTRAFAERLAARLTAAGHGVALAAMNDVAAAHADAARLIVLTATDGGGVAPPTADRFLDRLARLDRLPPFAVLGFGDSQAARFCGYAEDVHAALAGRGGVALLPLGRVDRGSEAEFSAWTEALLAALGQTPAEPPATRRRTLSGPAMGSRWKATVHAPPEVDVDRLGRDMATRVATIEARLSRFRAGSDVLRLDAAPLDTWISVSDDCVRVLAAALDVGRRSGGAFDIGLAAEVAAAGFGAGWAATGGVPRRDRRPPHAALEVDVAGGRVLKRAPVAIDLAGIAKGYAVDELARLVAEAGVAAYLVGLDGELKAGARQPDGRAWAVGVEAPVAGRRDLLGRVDLVDRAVATSGDYRRFDIGGRGHTLDPATGAPRRGGPVAVTALAASCMAADAWATALLVAGRAAVAAARAAGVEAIFTDAAPRTATPSLLQPQPARCPAPSA